MESSIARLTTMVSDLLDMSRLQTGAVLPIADDVPLGEVVRRALAGVEGAERVVVGELPTAYVDAGPARAGRGEPGRQRAAPQRRGRGRGRRRTARGSSCASSTTAPASPRPTGRGSSSRSSAGATPGTGVGLGLAVARGLTEAQGGTLEAESTPGGGLTMVLELPGTGA